jgi:hypothetical protein
MEVPDNAVVPPFSRGYEERMLPWCSEFGLKLRSAPDRAMKPEISPRAVGPAT